MDPISTISSSYIPAAPGGSSRPESPDSGRGTAAATGLPEDRVTLSGKRPDQAQGAQETAPGGADTGSKRLKPGEKTTADGTSLNDPQVQAQIARLKQTEEKVKAHEAAHKAVGGSLAGSASYSYTQGPDGRSYITGGEVQIDMSDGQTPQETISRMQQVIRAALAPSDPSAQDRSVAAQAASRMAQAQQEKAQAESPATRQETASAAAASAGAPPQTDQAAAQNAAAAMKNRIDASYGSRSVQGGDRPAADGSSVSPYSLISSFA